MAKYESKETISVDEKEFSFIDLKKGLENYLDNLKLKILVCGQSGIGKSSLLNFLLGKEVFDVGGPSAGSQNEILFDNFNPCTKHVEGVTVNVQGVLLTIFDSPGLQDGTENDAEYLQEMYDECSDAHLVLYCMDMTTTRWLPSEVKATKLVTEKFGKSFWEKSILVLTKANMAQPTSETIDATQHCKRIYNSFEAKFKSQLKSQGVPDSIAAEIPVIATGSPKCRHLPYVSSKVQEASAQPDFLSELWTTCVERLSNESRNNFIIATEIEKRCTNKAFQEKLRQQKASMEEEMAKLEEKLTREQKNELERLKKEHKERLQQYKSDFKQIENSDIQLDENQIERVNPWKVMEYAAKGALAGAAVAGGPGAVVGGLLGAVAGGVLNVLKF